jgi:isoleucyl-tRNA synthetase
MNRALAPVVPFITEVMYQNLICNIFENAYESIHHTDWPQVDQTAIDETLVYQMDLARRVAGLGLSARSNAGLKVRQPLAKVLAYVSEGQAELSDDLVEIVSDELNIKSFEFVEEASTLVNYKVLPVNKLLGPKFGADFSKVRAALSALDPVKVASQVQAGEPVSLDVQLSSGERTITLSPDEVLVNTEPAQGLAIASDKLVTVAVDIILTPALKAEGLAREIVRRVQAQRKNADFNIEDRISTWYLADSELAEVFQTWGEYIQAETLTTDLVAGDPPDEAFVEAHLIDGMTVTIGVKQN